MKKYSKGFGILEVLVAAGVLIVVIAGTAALANYSLRATVLASDRTMATQLAQEGIEKVREQRDTNWIDNDTGTSWSTLDELPDTQHLLAGVQFTRYVTIGTGLDASLLKVSSKVTWQEYGKSWNVELITYLSDWKPQY